MWGPPSLHPILPRPTVTTGVFLGQYLYHLHAWRLSCSSTKQQDFQKRSLGLQQHLKDLQQTEYTAIWLDFSHWSAGQEKGIDLLGPKAAPIAAFLYSSFCHLKLSKATGPA